MTGGHALDPGGAATEMMMGEEPGGILSQGDETSGAHRLSRAELELLAAAPPPPPPPPPPGQPKKKPASRSKSSSRREASSHLHQNIHSSSMNLSTSLSIPSNPSSDPPPSSALSSFSNESPSGSLREPSPTIHQQLHSPQEPQEPSPTSTYHQQREPEENVLEYQPEPSPSMVQKPNQPVSPLTAKTEELSNLSSPANKEDSVSPAEKRRRSRRDAESLANLSAGNNSMDPPTGNDHKGRIALDATPTAAQLGQLPETPAENSQAHYDSITNARHSTIHGGVVLPQQPGPSLTHASPTASSLATEPHSNAHALTQKQLPKDVVTRGAPRRHSRSELDTALLPPQYHPQPPPQQRTALLPPVPLGQNNDEVVPPVKEEPIIKPKTLTENIVSSESRKVEEQPDIRASSSSEPPSVVLVSNKNNNNDSEKENGKGKKKRGGFLGKIFKRGGRNKKEKESKASVAASVETDPTKDTSAKKGYPNRQEETVDDPSMVTYHGGVTVKSSSTREGGAPTIKSAPELINKDNETQQEEDDDAFDAFADDEGFATVTTTSPPNSSKTRPEISFLHDDVSTLTGPTFHTDTRRKSRDPAEAVPDRDQASNEPVGHYFNFDLDEAAELEVEQRPSIDPFEEPFFQPVGAPSTSKAQKNPSEPKNKRANKGTQKVETSTSDVAASAKSAKGNNGAELRINTMATIDSSIPSSAPTDDPMGDFATQSSSKRIHDPSPRGYATPEATNYPDPIGESPLHKHERGPVGLVDGHADLVPDPPLYLTSVPSQESSDDDVGNRALNESLDAPEDEKGPGNLPAEMALPSSSGTVGAIHPTSSQLSVPVSSSIESVSDDVIATQPAPPRLPDASRTTKGVPPPPPPPPLPTKKKEEKVKQHSQTQETKPSVVQTKVSGVETLSETKSLDKRQEKERTPAPRARSVSATRQRPRPEDKQFRRGDIHISTAPTEQEKEETREVSQAQNPSNRKISSADLLGEALLREAAKEKEPQVSPSDSTSSEQSMYDADTGEKLSPANKTFTRRRAPRRRRLHEGSKKQVSPKEASPSPKKTDDTAGNKLMISSMARMNAKAVAYLHTLNGEPSPRNAWQKPIISMDEEVTPASQTRGRNSLASAATEVSTPGNDDSKRFFRAYSGKFKGRRLSNKLPTPRSRLPKKEVRFTDKEVSASIAASTRLNRDVGISSEVVSMGFAAFRYRRECDIYSGKSQRVVPEKKEKPQIDQQQSVEESEPLDPIQRAGRRLLAKAAVPIQASARRYLAQQEAVDRMWALIEIQSYLRRWRAEANLLACSLAAVTIQRMIRGYLHSKHYQEAKKSATEIQRIVRGHLASAWAFDTVYSAIIMQSLARRFLTQIRILNQSFSATLFQSAFRGHAQRKIYLQERDASIQIQKFWRSQKARTSFKFTLIDVIIVQGVVRIWLARKRASYERNALENKAAQKIQSNTRAFIASNNYKKYKSATKIQAAWRGFQGYTDYIFYLVDVLLVQRVARRWLAVREANRRRKAAAATKIQALWRSFSAQFGFVRDLADIIRVQSIARVYLARITARQRKVESIEQNAASIRIQTAWRGFWEYSHYVIMQFEVTKLQALVRGVNTRKQQQFQLGCCILIQAAARRYLAQQSYDDLVMERVFTASKVLEMRERLSAERIQFWWSVVLECRREKQAALTIEKFFIMVKSEVEKEIRRQEKRKQEKREKRRQRKKKDKDDKVLERVWLNTVDDGDVDIIAYSASQSTMGTPMSSATSFTTGQTPRKAISTKNLKQPSSTKSSTTMMSPNVRHRSTSPSMDMVMRHEFNSESGGNKELVITDTKNIKQVPSSAIRRPKPIMTASSQASPVPSSGMDSLAFSKSEYSEDSPASSEAPSKIGLGLASPVFDSRPNPPKSSDKVNKYMNMYGLKSGSVRSTAVSTATPKSPSHFFSDEDLAESLNTSSSALPDIPSTPTHKISTVTPPVGSESQSATPTASLVKGLNISTDNPSQYQKALLAAAKASISTRKDNKPTSPSPRHGKMIVMNRYQRDKPQTPSQASGSDDSSFLAGEEFGMI